MSHPEECRRPMENVCAWLGCSKYPHRGSKLCIEHFNLKNGNTTGVGRGQGRPLTPEQKAEIRARLQRFESPKSIAAAFGISTKTVHRAAGGPK